MSSQKRSAPPSSPRPAKRSLPKVTAEDKNTDSSTANNSSPAPRLRLKLPPRPPPEPNHPSSEIIAKANIQLSRTNPVAALRLYTEILSESCPGHPCAFLNRSLCYLLLDYNELAAADAWRALMGGLLAREDEGRNSYNNQIAMFLREMHAAIARRDEWTLEPGCFIMNGQHKLLQCDLTSIDLRPCTKENTKETGKSYRLAIAADVVARAYFRLALSLYRCGGGAMNTALDIIDEAMGSDVLTGWQIDRFRYLGDVVFGAIWDFAGLDKNHSSRKGDGTSYSDPMITDDAKALLETRYTTIRRAMYPWDKLSLSQNNAHLLMAELNGSVNAAVPSCSIKMTRDRTKAPMLSLRARRNIDCGELIFTVSRGIYVSTQTISDRRRLCNFCGSALDCPDRAHDIAFTSARKMDNAEKRTMSIAEVLSPSLDYGDQDRRYACDNNVMLSSPPNSTSTLAEEPMREEEEPQGSNVDLQMCPGCHEVYYCTMDCHLRSTNANHQAVCGKGILEYLQMNVRPQHWPGLREPHVRRILNLVLLRVLAAIRNNDVHPLEQAWLRIMNGNLDEAPSIPDHPEEVPPFIRAKLDLDRVLDLLTLFPFVLGHSDNPSGPDCKAPKTPSSAARIPWSFDANVRGPWMMLLALGGPQLALDTCKYDSWVINTLLAKIDTATRISRGPRAHMKYGDDAKIMSYQPGQDLNEHNHQADSNASSSSPSTINTRTGTSEDDADEIWVGSLHPLATLVPTVPTSPRPSSKGSNNSSAESDMRDENVVLTERDGRLLCRAARSTPAPTTASSHEWFRTPRHTSNDNVEVRIRAGQSIAGVPGVGAVHSDRVALRERLGWAQFTEGVNGDDANDEESQEL